MQHCIDGKFRKKEDETIQANREKENKKSYHASAIP